MEQTKNLVAVHNLTEDKLLSTLKLGGFPMPSIAVTKSDIPHTNFGDISLVFGRYTVDPKANRKNAVYSADAWTPTFPKVEYEANSKVTSRVYERLGDLAGSAAIDPDKYTSFETIISCGADCFIKNAPRPWNNIQGRGVCHQAKNLDTVSDS